MADSKSARESEAYTQRDNPAFEAQLASRTASRDAAFFLPYLRPGMRLLDVGCGPGTITLGLAEIVAPGKVVGIDVRGPQADRARATAVERRVANVHFAAGDGYRLPFVDGSFDALFAHAVLMHLREPLQALAEMWRVLRPGGIVGVRDPDLGTNVFFPETTMLAQWRALGMRVRERNGADSFVGRRHRRLLLEAGFVRAEATATVECAGSLEQSRRHAAFFKDQLRGLAQTALAEGWVDQATVDAMVADIDAWAERPDAFAASIYCSAVAWKSA